MIESIEKSAQDISDLIIQFSNSFDNQTEKNYLLARITSLLTEEIAYNAFTKAVFGE